jgi:hypothetical protein
MSIRPIAAAPLVTGGLALAACGGHDPEPLSDRGSNDRQEREAALSYAQCMREQGIDMPDPRFGEDGTIVHDTPEGDRDELRAAQRACRRYRHGGGRAPSEEERQEQQEMLERAVAYAKCMREEGIDVPDPTTDEDGKNLILGQGLDRDDPDFSEADETCRSKLSSLPAAPASEPGGGDQEGKPFLGLGAVALLVGTVGVANSMIISVLERRSEIVRRALGATRRHVGAQFLAGVLLGALVTTSYAASQGWHAVVPPLAIAGGLVAATAIGALAGLYPRCAPPTYHPPTPCGRREPPRTNGVRHAPPARPRQGVARTHLPTRRLSAARRRRHPSAAPPAQAVVTSAANTVRVSDSRTAGQSHVPATGRASTEPAWCQRVDVIAPELPRAASSTRVARRPLQRPMRKPQRRRVRSWSGRGPGVLQRAIGLHRATASVKSSGDGRTVPIHARRPRTGGPGGHARAFRIRRGCGRRQRRRQCSRKSSNPGFWAPLTRTPPSTRKSSSRAGRWRRRDDCQLSVPIARASSRDVTQSPR